MKLPDIKHVFFDLDHTLWDFDRNSGLAFSEIFKRNEIKIELEEFLRVYTPINENYWKLYRENRISQEDLRYGRLKDSFDKLEVLTNDEQLALLSREYIDFLPLHNELLDGAKDLLEYLKPRYILHIITNGFKEVQYKKMENSGILNFFSTITTSEDAGVKKPNRLIFEKALSKAGADVASCLMIGDNYEADILGAQNIGMKAILYNYYKQEFSKDCLQVMKMEELTSYL